MATINENYKKLAAGYLFPEIAKRTKDFSEKNPGVHLLKLGIGNTTEPLTPTVIEGLHRAVDELATVETYSGYGDSSNGEQNLRELLQKLYNERDVSLEISEIFVSDGAKPDSGNIQSIFGLQNRVAVQDPAYPVYVDTNVIAGRAAVYNSEKGLYEGLIYMPCVEDNQFFPSIPDEKVDLIYLCSPNNPTGAVATKEQLQKFVDYARQHHAVIIFDAAYSAFISDDTLPRSIFEVEGSKECAIEINSFSKVAGFTGLRLGWSVVPRTLVAENAEPGDIHSLWDRRQNTFFNGASNIVQAGGVAALSTQGRQECQGLVDYYMDNANLIHQALTKMDMNVYGGINAPYVWLMAPDGMTSWEFFDKLLNEAHVVGTPGSGFGPSGEGFVRLSAFGHRQDIERAVTSIQNHLQL